MSNRFIEILPQNTNASHSYKEGRPVVDFLIAEQEATLLPRSIRVCGRFHAYEDAQRTMTTGSNLSMDSRIGMWSILDQVVLSSGRSHTTIEHLRSANRFYSSYMGVINDEKTLLNQYSNMGLTLPSTDGQQLSVMQEGNGANSNEFCIHIPTGMLMGTAGVNLSSQTGIGGLQISLHLSPDSMVLYAKDGGASADGLEGAFYELTDLKLVCEVSERVEAEPQPLEYNSITGYYTTINSANANLNFSLGLNRVSSTMVNFIPSDYLNNLDRNSLQTINPLTSTGDIANVSQLVMTKGGSRYPLDYNVDTIFRKGNTQVDPQIIRNFMNAVLPFKKITHTLLSPSTCNKSYTTDDTTINQGGILYGVGVAYDVLGSDGADFSREAWGLQLDLALDDNNPNSAFVFVHHKNTLVYNQGQVQVIS